VGGASTCTCSAARRPDSIAGSACASADARTTTVPPPAAPVISRQSANAISANDAARSAGSAARIRSPRERIYHDVDAELGVVDGEEPLVVGMVSPLRAVVLAAVEHGDAIAVQHGKQVLVDEVVAPSVQLVRGRRRPV